MAEGKQGKAKGLQKKNGSLLLSYFSNLWFAVNFLHLKM
jgi:hypothetical protein